MSAKKDITVVGAGPAGLVAAIDLKRNGYNVILREKQKQIGGEPGWHPSVHSTPVRMPALWDYIGIDCTECFVDTSANYKMFIKGKDMGKLDVTVMGYHLYNTERGPRASSLDSFLFRIAEKEGVNIELGNVLKDEDLKNAPQNTIIASGLSSGVYDVIEIPCSVFAGYWANADAKNDGPSAAVYMGVSNEYGYTGAMNKLWYCLLFARNEVSDQELDAFRKVLGDAEGYTFEKWKRFKGQTPKGPKLFHKQYILTGTAAGVVEPAMGFGITGALLSGKISAMAVYDRKKAESEFHKYTDGIITNIERKRTQKGSYIPMFKMGDLWFDIE